MKTKRRTQLSVYLTDKQVEVVKSLSEKWNKSINGTISKMLDDMITLIDDEQNKPH